MQQQLSKNNNSNLTGKTFVNTVSGDIVEVIKVEKHKKKGMVLLQQYRNEEHVFCKVIKGHCKELAEKVGWPLSLFRQHFKES